MSKEKKDNIIWHYYIVELLKKNYPFIVGFFGLLIYLLPRESMCDVSGDAADIWKTITTMGTDDVYGSYVLYKGFCSVYPFVWLYKVAVLLSFNEWFFIKVFYAVSFSYITSIGFPRLVRSMTGCVIKEYQELLVVIICFWLWFPNGAMTQFMVDLPCLMYFILLINSVFRIKNGADLFEYLWCGFCLGLCLCASGQYTLPALCILMMLIIQEFKRMRKKAKEFSVIKCFTLVACSTGVKMYNIYFLDSFVEGLRQKGAWIIKAGDWLSISYSRFMNSYRTGGLASTIQATRTRAIYKSYFGSQFDGLEELMLQGGYGMSILDYLKMFFKYPIDFCLCYFNSLVLCLTPDGGGFHFARIFVFYTLFFITLYIVYSKCKRVKDIFNCKLWIVIAFLTALIPLLLGNIEQRMCMQIQGLIIGVAICDDTLWNRVKNLKVKNNFMNFQLNYSLVGYILFIIIGFAYIGLLYEFSGAENINDILISW